MAFSVCSKSFRLSVMLGMTFGYFLVEIIVGYVNNSMALVADSFHMLSDVLALCIAFYCMKVSKRRSQKNTFGWVRAEILGALVNAVFLLALCFSIFVEAIKRLLEPERIEDPLQILIVGSIGFVVNIIGIFMFHSHAGMGGHGHSHGGKATLELETDDPTDAQLYESFQVVATEAHNVSVLNNMADNPHKLVHQSSKMARDESGLTPNHDDTTDESRALTGTRSNRVVIVDDKNNRLTDKKAEKTKKAGGTAAQMNMHGVFLHILGDAFGSLIVIISAGVCYFLKDKEYLQLYLDPSLSLIMVCVIVTTTVPLLKETALILLQTTPKYMNVQTMKAKLLEVDGVLAIHEFHVWRLAGQKIIATAHIRFRSLTDYLQAAEKIKNFFHEQEIHSTTIQPEFAEMIPAESNHELTSDGHCFLSCPPEQCDASATCCGPVDSLATKTAASSLSPRSKTDTAPPPPYEESAKSAGQRSTAFV
uniref:Zinc transporter 1 n=1 Tax=Plectus sambesii TaxID=2011161 RepID=A0A914VYZ7_9BILA